MGDPLPNLRNLVKSRTYIDREYIHTYTTYYNVQEVSYRTPFGNIAPPAYRQGPLPACPSAIRFHKTQDPLRAAKRRRYGPIRLEGDDGTPLINNPGLLLDLPEHSPFGTLR